MSGLEALSSQPLRASRGLGLTPSAENPGDENTLWLNAEQTLMQGNATVSAQGATGPAGADGATGPAGADGATGATGPAGAKGDPGLLDSLTYNHIAIGYESNEVIELQTGAKGRDLIALADDAALTAEILARVADSTIVGTKLEATSTDDDSIKTAGGASIAGVMEAFRVRSIMQSDIGGLSVRSNFSGDDGFNDSAWTRDLAGRLALQTHNDDSFVSNDYTLTIGESGASRHAWHINNVERLSLESTTPAAQSAANAAIGNGTVRAGTRIECDGTASDSIKTAGGISTAGAIVGRLDSESDGDSVLLRVQNKTSVGTVSTTIALDGFYEVARIQTRQAPTSTTSGSLHLQTRDGTSDWWDGISISRLGLITLGGVTTITGDTTPVAQPSGSVGIGDGVVRAGTKIQCYGTSNESIQTAGGVTLVGDIVGAAASNIYLGPSGTDGSWRMVRSGNDLVFQRRESGTWTTKSTISA